MTMRGFVRSASFYNPRKRCTKSQMVSASMSPVAANADLQPRGHTPKLWLHGSIEGRYVAIGPVQLIVLGFSHPEFHGEIIAELERLRESVSV